MLYSIKLRPQIKHRYCCDIDLRRKTLLPALTLHLPAKCIIDTGCINTLIPEHIAKICGTKQNLQTSVIVGGRGYITTAYSLDDVNFGGLSIKKMICFAAAYEGDLENCLLLGTNFLANLVVTLRKNENRLDVEEDIFHLVKGREYPYTFFFNKPDLQPVYPDLLETAEEYIPPQSE